MFQKILIVLLAIDLMRLFIKLVQKGDTPELWEWAPSALLLIAVSLLLYAQHCCYKQLKPQPTQPPPTNIPL